MSDTSAIRWQAATVVTLAVAVIVGAMWWSARSDVEDAERRLDAMIAEDARRGPDLGAEVRDALTFDAAIELAGPDLVTLRWAYLTEDDETDLRDLLDDLGFEDDIMERIGASRAADGMLTAEGDDVEAWWTYHPDLGLRMVLRRA